MRATYLDDAKSLAMRVVALAEQPSRIPVMLARASRGELVSLVVRLAQAVNSDRRASQLWPASGGWTPDEQLEHRLTLSRVLNVHYNPEDWGL